jgi:UDP-galactose transporter B1
MLRKELQSSRHHVSARDDDVSIDLDESNVSQGQPSPPPTFRYPTSEIGKLVFGAGGIYFSFLYYGSLQEDVFRFNGENDGQKFVYAWWLQFLEAGANVIVGSVGQRQEQQQSPTNPASLTTNGNVVLGNTTSSNGHNGGTTNHQFSIRQERLPLLPFFASGASQVISKACTSLALAHGLSFPVATLAKSGKMAPVMIGQLLLGGSHYSVRDYLQVMAIIGGTAILSMGNDSTDKEVS